MPNQSPLRQELEHIVSGHEMALTEAVDAILDVLIHALPERVFVASLSGSATAEGYKLAIKDVKQLLLEAKGDK